MAPDAGIEPELERLRSLLLDEERGRVAELERRVAAFEAWTAQTANVLPDIFTLSYSESVRERLIESMGPPVVDAAAKMATQETSRTARALAPVILPAIAAGVARELDKISRRAGSASPIARMRWRRESQRTGIPMDILVSRDSSPTQVVEAWIFDCRSGELIAHEQPAASFVAGANPDATAALLSAMRNFAVQHGMSPESGTVQRLDTGERTLWIVADGQIALAADLLGTSADTTEILQAEFQYLHVSHQLGMPNAHLAQWLTQWAGDTHARLRKRLVFGRWLRSGVIALVSLLLAGLLMAWYSGRVASGLENRFAETPGVASVSAHWSWRWFATATELWGPNWRVNLTSDPSIKPAVIIAQAFPTLTDRVTVRQQRFLSVDQDAIVTRLRESLESERDLAIRWTGSQVKISGLVSSAGMDQLRGWPWALLGLPEPDLSLLTVAPREAVRSAPLLDSKLPDPEVKK